MRFHKEGRTSIILIFLFTAAFLSLMHWFFPSQETFRLVGLTICFLLMVTILQFFRNPSRRFVQEQNAIIAPADGRVVVIEEVEEPEYFKDRRIQVSIFMSPTNVHINWFPISGEVLYSKYHPGKYLVAWHPKSSTDNERTSVVIGHPEFGPIMVRQIAGAMARRIVNYAEVGQQREQCEELGFIKFGSRVDLLLPLTAQVEVELNHRTRGGQTIIGRFIG